MIFETNFSLRTPAFSVSQCKLQFVSVYWLQKPVDCEILPPMDGCSLLGESMTFISHLGLACLMSY